MVGGLSRIRGGWRWRWLIRQLQMANLHQNISLIHIPINNTTRPNGIQGHLAVFSSISNYHTTILSLVWTLMITYFKKIRPSCRLPPTYSKKPPLANARGWLNFLNRWGLRGNSSFDESMYYPAVIASANIT